MIRSVLMLLICVKCSYGYSLMDSIIQYLDESEGPVWPLDYHIKAEKVNLDGGILENMEIWSSSAVNRSRIDYYNGLVKRYYYWETEDEHAHVYSFMPESTEDYQNKVKCTYQTIKEQKDMEACLPKVDNFTHTGKEELEGKSVDVWKLENVFEGKRWQEKSIYTYKVDGFDVPVRYEIKHFLIRNSVMTAHVIVNYYDFKPTVGTKVLDEGDTDECEYMGRFGEDFYTDIKHLDPAKDTDSHAAFHSFKKHHGKKYDSENEHELRKTIFQENWEMIENHNRKNLGYKMAMNQFADTSQDEMALYTGLLPDPPSLKATHPFPYTDEEIKLLVEELPENYDLRVEGVITPVKNQANCGSCWAFSSTAAVEGAIARSNGRHIVDLSEQSLVDCAWGLGCSGCDGGVMESAFQYILKHGIPMEREYGSYLEQDGLCHTQNLTTIHSIKGFAQPTPLNPQALKVALHKYGPVAVAINFNNKMKYYSSGIFFDPECNDDRPNHGVVVVGYGVRDGADFWIIKNSHGTDWGQAGYLYISASKNNCWVMLRPVYPIV